MPLSIAERSGVIREHWPTRELTIRADVEPIQLVPLRRSLVLVSGRVFGEACQDIAIHSHATSLVERPTFVE